MELRNVLELDSDEDSPAPPAGEVAEDFETVYLRGECYAISGLGWYSCRLSGYAVDLKGHHSLPGNY